MDDANVPSLLSLPYIGGDYDEDIWKRTYKWVWSKSNPYFYKGKYEGIGSPHTPSNYIWGMSLIIRGLVDKNVREEMKKIMISMIGSEKGNESIRDTDELQTQR